MRIKLMPAASAPAQARVHFYRFTIERDPIHVAAVEHEMMRDQSVAFAIVGIDFVDFRKPIIGRTVGQHFNGRMDSHRVQRSEESSELRPLCKSFSFVGIFQQQVGL